MAINKRKLLNSAQRHIQKGALDKALRDYQTLLRAEPNDVNVRIKVCDLQLRRGKIKNAVNGYLKVAEQFVRDGFDAKAVAIYKQVTKIDPEQYQVYLPLAELYERIGLTSEAISAFAAAVEGYQRHNRKSEALDLLRKMSSLEPGNVQNRLRVADLLAAEERREEALDEYRQALTELEHQGDWEREIAVYERVIAIDSGESASESLLAFARLLKRHDRLERALEITRELLSLHAESAEANEIAADILAAQGELDAARPFYRSAAVAWRARGDGDRAGELMEQHFSGVSLSPESSELEGESDTPDTDPLRTEAVAAPPPAPELIMEDSPTLLIGELSSSDAAFSDLAFDADSPSLSGQAVVREDRSGLSLDSQDTDSPTPQEDPLVAEASVYARYGKYDRAIHALNTLLEREPHHIAALEQLGEALIAVGQLDEGVAAWVQAAQSAATQGDREHYSALRTRIEARDPGVAEQLPPLSDAVVGEGFVAEEAGGEERGEDTWDSDTLGNSDPDSFLSAVTKEDIRRGDLGGETEPVQVVEAESSAAVVDPGESSHEGIAEIEIDPSSLVSPEPPPVMVDAGRESSPRRPPPAAEPIQVLRQLESANRCLDAGQVEEAVAIYRSILDVAPHHRGAKLRLQELEVVLAKERAGENPVRAGAFEDEGARTAIPLHPVEDGLPVAEAFAAAASPPDVGWDAAGVEAEDSFDLTAELSDVLDDEEDRATDPGEAEQEQVPFDVVFEEFQHRVAEVLGDNPEGHYELGIAYREMGLLEAATGEFQHAVGDPTRGVAALDLIALCALELKRPVDAIAHLEQALARPEISNGCAASLHYDLASAYEALGQWNRSLQALRRAVQIEPNFRDIADRIAALELRGDLPGEEEEDSGAVFEILDEVIADAVGAGVEEERAPVAHDLAADGAARRGEAEEKTPPPRAAARPAPPVHSQATEAPASEPQPTAGNPPRRRKISFV